jgi:hypothetical protein
MQNVQNLRTENERIKTRHLSVLFEAECSHGARKNKSKPGGTWTAGFDGES